MSRFHWLFPVTKECFLLSYTPDLHLFFSLQRRLFDNSRLSSPCLSLDIHSFASLVVRTEGRGEGNMYRYTCGYPLRTAKKRKIKALSHTPVTSLRSEEKANTHPRAHAASLRQ